MARTRPAAWLVAVAATGGVAIAVLLGMTVDGDALADAAHSARADPFGIVLCTTALLAAFSLRALAWRQVLPALRFGHALAGIHLALGANHVLPLRMGEPLRIASVVRRTDVRAEAATASTLTLRAGDIVSLAVVGLIAAPNAFTRLLGGWGWALIGAVAGVFVAGLVWLRRSAARGADVRLPGTVALAATTGAWALEAIVMLRAAGWAGIDLRWSDAAFVTAAAVGAQVLAFAPSGIGTYEAAAVAALTSLGHDARTSLVVALGAHALKTAYSLVAGAIALVLPRPGFLGRVRLDVAPRRAPRVVRADLPERGPVVLVLPAHNEAASVAGVIARVPAHAAGRPVEVVVVDDGSDDATAAVAADAGAIVVRLPRNRGLGAAVREGLRFAVEERGAVTVAFCDADGEYAPEELALLVEPILDGRADYVVGSRFSGEIHHMRPWRRFGNRTLTAMMRRVARAPITDGQSGYRALSRAAASYAEIIHDYNYAQVLTLDLLAKGYRYCEVPISYRFRTTGRSFVRLGPYLRRVVPAVLRELNAPTVTRPFEAPQLAAASPAGTLTAISRHDGPPPGVVDPITPSPLTVASLEPAR